MVANVFQKEGFVAVTGKFPFSFVFDSDTSRDAFLPWIMKTFDKIFRREIWVSDEVLMELGRMGWIFFSDALGCPIAFKPRSVESKGQVLFLISSILSEKFIGDLSHELNHMFKYRLAGDRPFSPTVFEYCAMVEEKGVLERNFPGYNLDGLVRDLSFYVDVICGRTPNLKAHFYDNHRTTYLEVMERLDFERRVWLMERIMAVTGDELV